MYNNIDMLTQFTMDHFEWYFTYCLYFTLMPHKIHISCDHQVVHLHINRPTIREIACDIFLAAY